MNETEERLARIRGAAVPLPHSARTIAGLTTNPGCARRAVLDAAGIDKSRLAGYAGFPMPFGQSRFAITRGNAFEAQVKADGCAELVRLLRLHLGLTIPEVSYDNLESVGDSDGQDLRFAHSRNLLTRAAAGGDGVGTLFDHPLLRLAVGGRRAYLEPDLIAFQLRGKFWIVEIKSFPIIDGQADAEKVAAAVTQAAVYVIALRELLAEAGHPAEAVADEVLLVCPENFANRPTAVRVDVRKQLTVLRRQLSRMQRIDRILAALPPGLSLDLAPDAAGVPTRPVPDIVAALGCIEARYAPECLSTCELGYLCRHEHRDDTATLGRAARDELGGVDSMAAVLGLADGTLTPAPDQEESAELLRTAARLRAESLPGSVPPPPAPRRDASTPTATAA